jgi:hypothetical protein
MPDHEIKQRLTFIVQNKGKLSSRKRDKFFEKLSDKEVTEMEIVVKHYFEFK